MPARRKIGGCGVHEMLVRTLILKRTKEIIEVFQRGCTVAFAGTFARSRMLST